MNKKESNPLKNMADKTDELPRWAQSTVNGGDSGIYGKNSVTGGFPIN